MLGIFNLLSLLKGWEYKYHTISRVVTRGLAPIDLSISETGWVLALVMVTDDSTSIGRWQFQGAELELHTFEASPDIMLTLGAIAQDPAGWLQKYFRPNPNATAGIFNVVLFSGGYQGSAWPYIPTTRLWIELPLASTQATATIAFFAWTIAITNRELFIKSLRQLLDSNANITVPKELLSLGPTELKQQESSHDLLKEIRDLLKSQKG